MMTNLHRHLKREDGVAMIVALMVSFVVLMLSTIVVAQSLHSLDASGYDRQRLLSVNAAEAGTNAWYHHLQTTPILTLAADCTMPPQDIDTGLPWLRSRRRRSSTPPTARRSCRAHRFRTPPIRASH